MEFLNYWEATKHAYSLYIFKRHFNNLTSVQIEALQDDVADIWLSEWEARQQ